MADPRTATSVETDTGSTTRIVEGREIVSVPGRAIQVERLQISSTQVSSVSAAIRAGKEAASTKSK